jgi:cell wall-associated NlpC family hydrolase
MHGAESTGAGVMIRDLIGVKYKPHGRTVEEGFDCYGVLIEYFKRKNIYLPDVFYENTEPHSNKIIMEILEKGLPVKKIDKPEKDCVIEFFITGIPSHAGVYLGEGEFLHATKEFGVTVQQLAGYRKRVKGYYRVEYGNN